MTMQVVYCSSDSYAPTCAVSITSLAKKHFGDELVVNVVSTDMTPGHEKLLYDIAKDHNFSLKILNISDQLESACTSLKLPKFRGGYEVYTTLFLSTCFPHLDRIMFIDADTLIMGDLAGVWEINLEGNVAAAVPDFGNYGKYSRSEDEWLLRKNTDYFNSGFLVIDLARWRTLNIPEMLQATTARSYKIYDQSILNDIIGDKIMRLPLGYNLTTCAHGVSPDLFCRLFASVGSGVTIKEVSEAQLAPVVVHFVGNYFERPWYRNGYSPYKTDYLELCEVAPLAPDFDVKGKEPCLTRRIYYSLLMLLRCFGWFNMYAFIRYYLVQRVINIGAGFR